MTEPTAAGSGPTAPAARQERLVTARFAIVVGSGLAYFTALGVVLPVVPQYVQDELRGGSVSVGIAVGALFVGAVLLRPYVGRLGDRVGRRVLMIVGALVVAVSIGLYGVIQSLGFLVAARMLTGVGEAAFFVGAATMITDLAPVDRRGEAISYWSVAVYGGLAFGPVIGESVRDSAGFEAAWAVGALLAVIATALATCTREVARPHSEAPTGGTIVNRAAVAPGAVLFGGLIALAAFTAFIPLYVDETGLHSADVVFLLYGGIVLVVRIVGARLPDSLGARRAGGIALLGSAAGMAIMAVWGSTAGLLVGTAFFAIGASLLYPALLLLALGRAPESERGSVVGTFSAFFDLSQGLGSLAVGGMAAATSYRGAFALGAGCSMLGYAGLRFQATRGGRRARVADAGALASEHPAP